MQESTKASPSQGEELTRHQDVAQPDIMDDELMEVILENLHTTPLGQVLKRIALHDCIRKGKVFNIRKKLLEGTYDLDERLDAAIDRVLEDLTD
ncbi:MAG: hypothetical protein QHH07_00065 [Sedimentisphaerales bacterium]|nr:hypothetical protein [Sedimentisphaerales bacterium]